MASTCTRLGADEYAWNSSSESLVQTLDLARSPSIAGAPVHLGFRRIVTLHCCSSALHQIHGKRLGASVPEPTVQPDPGVLCRARAGADERRVWPGRRCHFWQKMAENGSNGRKTTV